MWNGNHDGAFMISIGMTGTARQGTMPNSASVVRVKTLLCAAPPWPRIASRARTMWGASAASPIMRSAT